MQVPFKGGRDPRQLAQRLCGKFSGSDDRCGWCGNFGPTFWQLDAATTHGKFGPLTHARSMWDQAATLSSHPLTVASSALATDAEAGYSGRHDEDFSNPLAEAKEKSPSFLTSGWR